MGQILRHHAGTLTAPASLLDQLDNVLALEDGPGADALADIFNRVEAIKAEGADPEHDDQLARDTLALGGHWALNPHDLHALHQLRSTAVEAGRPELLLVQARWASDIRNALDTLTLGCDSSCAQLREELLGEGLSAADPLVVTVTTALAEGRTCGSCELCQFTALRDQLDALLDAAGFDGGSNYRQYVRQTP